MNDFSIHLLPLLPAWAIVLLAVGLLGLLANGCRVLLDKQVPRVWVKRLGALRVAIVVLFVLCLLQPVVSFSQSGERRPALLVLVDSSKSMTLSGAGKQTRLDDVRATLSDGELLARLRSRFDVHWFAFDRTAHALEPAELANLQADGDATDFAESLNAAWTQAQPAVQGRPARVLLVSDGNDLGQHDVVEVARRHGLVIDTLAPRGSGDTPAAGRVVIAQVQCAPRTLLGSEAQFRVALRAEQSVDVPLTLRLLEDGKEVLSRPVSFARGQNELQQTFAHRPVTAGLKKYQVEIAGKNVADVAPYQVSVQVVDNKHQVLILEDTWRWDFKYLRRVLEDDPSFSYTAMLARGGGAFVHFGEPDRRVNLGGFPQGRDELNWFDTIILGDVDPRRWPRGLAPALARCVAEDGKSVVVIAGPNLTQLAEVSVLNALLPVELSRASGTPIDGPIEVRLTPEALRTSFFFGPATEKEASAFAQLPPLDQIYPPLRKRPAASVLLEATRQANNHGNLIVMAEHTVGRGRVLFIGTDTLWKWQTLGTTKDPKATPYTLFWQQALRALAPARPGSGAVNLWLQPEHSRYEAGQRVRIRAEIQAEQPLVQPVLQATVVLPDERRLPLAFAPDPADPQKFRAEFEASLPGQYRLSAALLREGKLAAEVATALDVEPAQAELAGTRVDETNLSRIAAATGGRAIQPADPDTWPGDAETQSVRVREVRTLDLWNNFTLLLILSVLLGTDWLLRLLRGFA